MGGRVRRIRKEHLHIQDPTHQIWLFAAVLVVLGPIGPCPGAAQPAQDPTPRVKKDPPLPDPPAPSPPPPQALTNANLEIYGFAMLDNGYNAGQIDPNWFDVMRPSKLPSFND